jgi:hypothetical protein
MMTLDFCGQPWSSTPIQRQKQVNPNVSYLQMDIQAMSTFADMGADIRVRNKTNKQTFDSLNTAIKMG